MCVSKLCKQNWRRFGFFETEVPFSEKNIAIEYIKSNIKQVYNKQFPDPWLFLCITYLWIFTRIDKWHICNNL